MSKYFHISDNDECKSGNNNCNANAKCTNTVGSFDCNCNSGFSGNGVDCEGDMGYFFQINPCFFMLVLNMLNYYLDSVSF